MVPLLLWDNREQSSSKGQCYMFLFCSLSITGSHDNSAGEGGFPLSKKVLTKNGGSPSFLVSARIVLFWWLSCRLSRSRVEALTGCAFKPFAADLLLYRRRWRHSLTWLCLFLSLGFAPGNDVTGWETDASVSHRYLLRGCVAATCFTPHVCVYYTVKHREQPGVSRLLCTSLCMSARMDKVCQSGFCLEWCVAALWLRSHIAGSAATFPVAGELMHVEYTEWCAQYEEPDPIWKARHILTCLCR